MFPPIVLCSMAGCGSVDVKEEKTTHSWTAQRCLLPDTQHRGCTQAPPLGDLLPRRSALKPKRSGGGGGGGGGHGNIQQILNITHVMLLY